MVSIGSDNDLSSDRREAIIWTDAGILVIKPLGTNFSEVQNTKLSINENAFENIVCEIAAFFVPGVEMS